MLATVARLRLDRAVTRVMRAPRVMRRDVVRAARLAMFGNSGAPTAGDEGQRGLNRYGKHALAECERLCGRMS